MENPADAPTEKPPQQTQVGWIWIAIGIGLALAFGGWMGWLSHRATHDLQDTLTGESNGR